MSQIIEVTPRKAGQVSLMVQKEPKNPRCPHGGAESHFPVQTGTMRGGNQELCSGLTGIKSFGDSERNKSDKTRLSIRRDRSSGGGRRCRRGVASVDQLNPDASVLALASIRFDIAPIVEGSSVTILWRGLPVFIRHRTQAEIEEARAVPMADLKDPQRDEDRVIEGHNEWLIMIANCTHLGCVPVGEAGDFDGWFCPCHGSHYDTSGRIRRGPAPANLVVPPYEFISDTVVQIG